MKIMLKINMNEFNKVRDMLLKDETVNRGSMTFKEGKEFGVEGYVCYISGTEECCKRTLEILKVGKEGAMAEELEKNKKEEIIKKIKEEEDRAMEGFGSILG
jgi:polyhydroxyalkanoate synthesis regulator phasin